MFSVSIDTRAHQPLVATQMDNCNINLMITTRIQLILITKRKGESIRVTYSSLGRRRAKGAGAGAREPPARGAGAKEEEGGGGSRRHRLGVPAVKLYPRSGE